MIDHAEESLSLFDLLNTLQGVVEDVFAAPLWIRCEVIAAHPRAKGYWRLQVQDPVAGGEATAEVMVWRTQVPAIIHRFERMTGHPLGAGMQVLLQVKVNFSPKWGLGLTAQAIDPAFTIGQAQMEQDRIRRTLQEEGLWQLQQRLPIPASFSHVALIAPDGSAGLGDVMRETERMETSGLCEFEVLLSPFEGPRAVTSLVALLEGLTDPTHYDAVLMVRGGGGTAGIQTLNHEALVRALCKCPIPVFVGIGHERDHTLLDEVAFGSLGTPSKAVGHIASTVVAQAQEALALWATVQQHTQRRLSDLSHQVNQLERDLHQGARQLLEQAERQVGHHHDQIHERAERNLERAENELGQAYREIQTGSERLLERAQTSSEALIQEALTLGPQATLGRGYAWVSGPTGNAITSAIQARQTPTLTLHFKDGPLSARPEIRP